MKRVLIISYYWPPSGGSGVQRWVKFAKYLPEEGWQPVIYTPENPELTATDMSLANDIPEEAEIIRRHITEPYGIYRALSGKNKKKQEKDEEVNPINGRKKTVAQKISMFIRGNFFIPDPRCLWIGPSVRFLKQYLKEHPVDAIVSTGPPHSMHLIARRLAGGTSLPWVADFRDPWTKMFYFKHLNLCPLARKLHESLERKVLDDADIVVAVSPLVQEEFQAMTSTPVELVTNGYDEEDFSAPAETDGFFNVTHTGLFSADGNPENLWEALSDKCREDAEFASILRIRLSGKTDKEITDAIHASGLGDKLTDSGYISHRDAVLEQRKAALLILPLRKEPEYRATLPGKLFEYLASLKPVIGIGQTDGSMARILNATKAGIVLDWSDKSSIRRYIDFCWERFQKGTPAAETENIGQYSRKELTRKMADILNSLTQK